MASIKIKQINITHVVIASPKTFEEVRAALETQLPWLDPQIMALIGGADLPDLVSALEALPALSIFGSRNHGSLLRIANLKRQAIQYEIGNPLTASKMTRHRVSAGIYAPVRVLLRENEGGDVAFEYDSPLSLFEQFDDPIVDAVAAQLDKDLEKALLTAAT